MSRYRSFIISEDDIPKLFNIDDSGDKDSLYIMKILNFLKQKMSRRSLMIPLI